MFVSIHQRQMLRLKYLLYKRFIKNLSRYKILQQSMAFKCIPREKVPLVLIIGTYIILIPSGLFSQQTIFLFLVIYQLLQKQDEIGIYIQINMVGEMILEETILEGSALEGLILEEMILEEMILEEMILGEMILEMASYEKKAKILMFDVYYKHLHLLICMQDKLIHTLYCKNVFQNKFVTNLLHEIFFYGALFAHILGHSMLIKFSTNNVLLHGTSSLFTNYFARVNLSGFSLNGWVSPLCSTFSLSSNKQFHMFSQASIFWFNIQFLSSKAFSFSQFSFFQINFFLSFLSFLLYRAISIFRQSWITSKNRDSSSSSLPFLQIISYICLTIQLQYIYKYKGKTIIYLITILQQIHKQI